MYFYLPTSCFFFWGGPTNTEQRKYVLCTYVLRITPITISTSTLVLIIPSTISSCPQVAVAVSDIWVEVEVDHYMRP